MSVSRATPSERFRVGVLGAGFMSQVHAAAARRAGARVVGAVGSRPERADAAVAATGAEQGYDDLAELLSAGVDVVHVCTPNATHAELVDQALAHGAHVVCEKPLATRTGEARRLVEAASAGGVVGAVPFVYRFHPMVREMRARVESGEPGRIAVVHGGYLQDWLSSKDDDNWRVDSAQGGPSRAFADIGSHWCDLTEFVLGERIARLSARTATVQEVRADNGAVSTEDLVTLHFETTSGVVGTSVICQVAAGRKNRLHLEISGTDASLAFDQEYPERLWVGGRAGNQELLRDPETLSPAAAAYSRLPAGHGQGYQDCFDSFVADTYEAVGTGQVPDGLPLFGDGLRAVCLTEAVLASAAEDGAWTKVQA